MKCFLKMMKMMKNDEKKYKKKIKILIKMKKL